MYHRVAEENVDPWELCVTKQHFAEQLEVLKRETHPISLKQLVRAHTEGHIPDRAVAVTFDDGYADNFYSAKPLLEQYDIPATVFVASGYVEHEREFWWDELERVLLRPGTLPKILSLRIHGKTFEWDLGEFAHYSEEDYRRYSYWTVAWQGNPSLRQSLYLSLHKLLQPLLENERLKVMDELWENSGGRPVRRQTHRTLSIEELRALTQSDLIDIGAHTVTHSFLSAHPEGTQQDEVRQSKILLEESIGRPVETFAYPYGNYAKATPAIVRDAGFACACSTIVGSVWRRSDRFQLPRLGVTDLDGERFAKWLTPILDHNKIV